MAVQLVSPREAGIYVGDNCVKHDCKGFPGDVVMHSNRAIHGAFCYEHAVAQKAQCDAGKCGEGR